jgi:hypothetical protein
MNHIAKRSRSGRPPLKDGEESVQVNVTLCVSDYDRVFALASRSGVSVPKVFRHALHRLLRDGASGE